MIQINYKSVKFSSNIAEYQALFTNQVSASLSVDYHDVIKNLEFGKTYYIYYNNKLMAFKIHAFSVTKNLYLIQTPTEIKWLNIRKYKIFNTKEEFFLCLENKCNPIVLETAHICLFDLPYFNSTNYTKLPRLKNAFKWSKDNAKPIQELSYIYDVLFDGKTFIVYYELMNDCFNTYEECVQHHLNGMVIEEFEEDCFPTISITIETEVRPKIHTLRFIEG